LRLKMMTEIFFLSGSLLAHSSYSLFWHNFIVAKSKVKNSV